MMKNSTWQATVCLLAALALALSACANATGGRPGGGGGADDAGRDAGDAGGVTGPDGPGGGGGQDAGPSSGDPDGDTGTVEDTGPQLGSFGDPCEGNEDCRSGVCVESGGRSVCTVPCGECPPGWACRSRANTGADVASICVPLDPQLCEPCGHDDDCGGPDDLCMEIGQGTYCGAHCGGGLGCVEGFSCEAVYGEDAEVLPSQCLPEAGSCSPCVDPDDDGYGVGGDCLGPDCDPEEAEVHPGATEVCNRRDDDCDHDVDEDVVPPDDGCLVDGVCAGVAPRCFDGEWVCPYPDTWEPDGEVSCDGLDNDCNGKTDEPFDLLTSLEHCGACNQPCAPPHGTGACEAGECGITECDPGWHDVDGSVGNGCEYDCEPTGEEACDGADNDCDGEADEGFDLTTDLDNCGVCGRACQHRHAGSECRERQCVMLDCEEGWWDVDEDPANGCEYACEVAGEELCNEVDDDCDGATDEGFDLTADLANCGVCGRVCAPDHALPVCAEGLCGVARCEDGWHDLDANPLNGCEYGCVPVGDEVCNEADDDCDGDTDEGFDLDRDLAHCGGCGRQCKPDNADGVCREGHCQVERCDQHWYDIDEDPGNGCEYPCEPAGAELCNHADDDCDGDVDEDFDLTSDPDNCGECDMVCIYAHGVPGCRGSRCELEGCDAGHVDLDLVPDNGCECTIRDEHDEPDPGFEDLNCDGVDGDVDEAVFVAPDGVDGDPGTPRRPVRTLARAIQLSLAAQPFRYVIAAEGVFPETLTLQAGVRIHGGYLRAALWARLAGSETVVAGGTKGTIADGLDGPVLLDRLTLRSADAGAAGGSSYALWVRNSGNHLTLQECRLEAGAGAVGQGGGPGAGGPPGASGRDGAGG